MRSTSMRDRSLLFRPLRLSLFAAIGVATGACGSSVEVSDGSGGAGNGGGAGGGGAGGSGASGGTGGVLLPTGGCQDPAPIFQANGQPTGFVQCADGTRDRAEAVSCMTEIEGLTCEGTEDFMNCTTDAECTERPYGRCLHDAWTDPGGDYTTCGCVYSCATDADCGVGQACVCNGVAGGSFCVTANCLTNTDCATDECSLSAYDDGCGTSYTLQCRTDVDDCRTAADCVGNPNGDQCVADYVTETWTCLGVNCAIGRPLMVAGAPRAASARGRTDWRDVRVAPSVAGLDPELRAALATRWASVAAMEHASVASFARFTLQLMALGAPAELLAETQRAAADEVEHARIAYAIASAYAGRALGPDALDVADLSIATDRARVLRGLIEEACVGEAIGVAEALALADATEDPALREVMAKVASDEQRHAALAWRTLRWLLNDADEATLEVARGAFQRSIEAMRAEPRVEGPTSSAHGLFSANELSEVRRQALDTVVEPCAVALLGEVREWVRAESGADVPSLHLADVGGRATV